VGYYKIDYCKLSTTEKKVLRKIFGPVYNMEMRMYEEDIIMICKIYVWLTKYTNV